MLRETAFWSAPALDPPDAADVINSRPAMVLSFEFSDVEVDGETGIDEAAPIPGSSPGMTNLYRALRLGSGVIASAAGPCRLPRCRKVLEGLVGDDGFEPPTPSV